MARAGAVGKSIGCLAASANPEKGIQAISTAKSPDPHKIEFEKQ